MTCKDCKFYVGERVFFDAPSTITCNCGHKRRVSYEAIYGGLIDCCHVFSPIPPIVCPCCGYSPPHTYTKCQGGQSLAEKLFGAVTVRK